MNICIRTIRDGDELSRIEGNWDSLASKCSGNPFLLFGLVKNFISLGKVTGWNPMIVVISKEENLLGVLPLMMKRVYGLRFAKFVLKPSYSPDLIMCNEDRNKYASLTFDYMFNHLGCHILSLDLEAESQDLTLLKDYSKTRGIHYSTASGMGHRVLPITSTWEEYEKSQGSNFRNKFRKIERNLGKIGAWKVVHVVGGEIGPEILDKILEVEKESWKETWRARKGSSIDDVLVALWKGLEETKTQSDLEWSVWFLEMNGHPIAYSLLACYAGTAYIIKTSYKARYRRFYPGIYVNHAVIRHFWNTKTLKLIDFLTDMKFMETWTDKVLGRNVIVMSKNPLLPMIIGSFFLNDKMKGIMGATLKKAIENVPIFAGL
jgi:hypothetical protein